MMGLASFTASLKAISALDIVLWDVAAKAAGFVAINLGRCVLRTETAALGALAAMSALWE